MTSNASFVQYYSGQHSIDFIQNGSRKNTWRDFHLIPAKRPELAEPQPLMQSVNIPGTDKRIDIVGSLPEGITYDIRQGTWEFIIDHDQWSSWDEAYRELAKAINGQYMTIMLNNGSVYGYTGRLRVQGYNPGSNWSTITIEYMLDGGRYVVGRLISKTITTNGVYRASDDEAEGYSQVTVNVYANPKLKSKSITQNGTYRASYENYDGYSSVEVDVPNTYTQSDEGKVISNSQLVSQTSRSVTENGNYDTTTNDSVSVNVPNTYTQSDEGKVVSNSQLVPQTSRSVTANGSYDTTSNNSVTVNVQPNLQSKTATSNGEVTADSGYDGLSSVLVDVEGSGGYTINDILEHKIYEAIDDNITKIMSCAFYGYSSLSLVSFPSCSLIGSSAFFNCSSLASISFPVCTSIYSYAFFDCRSLSFVDFPACKSIGASAFVGNRKLSSISFPVCTLIDSYAFYNCSLLSSVSFPSCTVAGSYAFYNCYSLSNANFSVCTTLSAGVFYNCSSLTSVSFPVCTSIGGSAFYNCSSLSSVSFPICASIGSYAFRNCRKITEVYFMNSTICTLAHSNAFQSTPIAGYTQYTDGQVGSIYVPASLADQYKSAANWSFYSERIVGI